MQAGLTEAKSRISEHDRVKAANDAYYAALSARDLHAMEQIWARSPHDTNVAPPTNPVVHTGWDAIKKNYQTYWGTLENLTVTMVDPRIVIHGSVAWVYGTEHARRTVRGGQVGGGPNFGTSVFVKEGKLWLMVFHQAALMPNPR